MKISSLFSPKHIKRWENAAKIISIQVVAANSSFSWLVFKRASFQVIKGAIMKLFLCIILDFLRASVLIVRMRQKQVFHLGCNSEFGLPVKQWENIVSLLYAEQRIEPYRYTQQARAPRLGEKKSTVKMKEMWFFSPTPRCVLYLPHQTCVKKRSRVQTRCY